VEEVSSFIVALNTQSLKTGTSGKLWTWLRAIMSKFQQGYFSLSKTSMAIDTPVLLVVLAQLYMDHNYYAICNSMVSSPCCDI